MQLQPLWQRELFSGPHRVHAFYRSPSPPPPPAQAVGDLQGSEVRGREERQAFLLSFSQEWKGEVFVREKMSGKDRLEEKKISVCHDICTRMNILKSRNCILFKCWIWNPNISCLRYYPRATGYSHVFFFFFFFLQQMRCKQRCLWGGRRTGCWVGEQGERSLGGLTLWYGALKRPLEGVQYQEQD